MTVHSENETFNKIKQEQKNKTDQIYYCLYLLKIKCAIAQANINTARNAKDTINI